MNECPICFEEMNVFITVGCCKKNIHLDCFLKCLKETESCPFCRKHYMNPFTNFRTQTVVQILDSPVNRQIRTIDEVYCVYYRLQFIGVCFILLFLFLFFCIFLV